MTYPEAVTYLLNGETGEIIRGGSRNAQRTGNRRKEIQGKRTKNETEKQSGQKPTERKERKELVPPQKNDNMKRVYAYLLQKRHISREVLSFFAKRGTLYESADHHNAVFAGVDKDGNIRHIHKKGTNSEGKSFRINEEGSDPAYGFGYAGRGNKLYVFEAPIDLLSFLTLYPKNWQENSYVVLNGVSEHAMLRMLSEHPNLDTVILCLDHDPAGIEACGRLAEILAKSGHTQVQYLRSSYKDWNEDLKHLHGEPAIPAQEHPGIKECYEWTAVLKEVAESVQEKYATKETICRYYRGIYNDLKKGTDREHLENAFDGDGMLLAGVLVRCMEKEGRALGWETDTGQILDNICRRYLPHQDKGNMNTRLRNMQRAFEETMQVFDTKDLNRKENKELLVRKCMSLTMECIKAHIFVAMEYGEQGIKQKEQMGNDVQEADSAERGEMMVCSR